jgi:hypothetical protein
MLICNCQSAVGLRELSVPSATSGLVITEDELGKYQEENRRKEVAKQEKLAATEANKLKRSKAANTRAAQAQEALTSYSASKEWQKLPAPASGRSARSCW